VTPPLSSQIQEGRTLSLPSREIHTRGKRSIGAETLARFETLGSRSPRAESRHQGSGCFSERRPGSQLRWVRSTSWHRERERKRFLVYEARHSVGRINDVSAASLRIEESGIVPPIGTATPVVFPLDDFCAFQAESIVVRYTERGGFAVARVAVEPQVNYLV
jgi:hypothetical protein